MRGRPITRLGVARGSWESGLHPGGPRGSEVYAHPIKVASHSQPPVPALLCDSSLERPACVLAHQEWLRLHPQMELLTQPDHPPYRWLGGREGDVGARVARGSFYEEGRQLAFGHLV